MIARIRTFLTPYRWLAVPILAFILSRGLIFSVGFLGDTMLPTEEGHWIADPESPFLSMWAKWDSQYYVDIAKNGYWFKPEQQSNVAFFPLYPMLMRIASNFTDGNLILAGFIISNLALFGTLAYFYLLAEVELDKPAAQRAVFYLALFPTAFFFNSVYTESLFLFLTISAMYYARKHNWVVAAGLGLLAASTRNIGILIWPLIFWEWLRVQGWQIGNIFKKEMWLNLWKNARVNWMEAVIICVVPFGMLIFILFLQQNFGRPLAFIETQAAWGRENVGTIAIVKRSLSQLINGELNRGWFTGFWNTFSLLAFLAFVPFIWIRFGEGYAIYVLIQLIVPSSSATGSIIRYVLTMFPAFLLLADWGKHHWLDRTLTLAFTVLLGVFVTIFVNWVFVA